MNHELQMFNHVSIKVCFGLFSLLFPFKFQINRRFHGLMGHKPMTLDVDLDIQKGRMQDVKLKVCYLKLNASCRTSPLRYIYTERKRFFLWSLSLLNVNIKLDFLWTHLEAMSLSLSRQYKRTLTITLLVGQLHLRVKNSDRLDGHTGEVYCIFE